MYIFDAWTSGFFSSSSSSPSSSCSSSFSFFSEFHIWEINWYIFGFSSFHFKLNEKNKQTNIDKKQERETKTIQKWMFEPTFVELHNVTLAEIPNPERRAWWSRVAESKILLWLDSIFALKTCGATWNHEFPWTGLKPVKYFRVWSSRGFYFGSVRVGVFFTGVWDIFSRISVINLHLNKKKHAFHSRTEQVELLLSLISTLYDAGMMLLLYCRALSHLYCSLKVVNFGLMINCFGLVWSGPGRI